jgi:thymidylate synthase (FAD)
MSRIVCKPSVRLIDFMGDDRRVVDAARVSMRKKHNGGPLTIGDEKLICYLAKHRHFTPFTHVLFTFHLEVPIFVARQWFKHQVGITRNEVSRRYVDDAPAFYVPEELRTRPPKSIKQGSGVRHPRGRLFLFGLRLFCHMSGAIYAGLIRVGVAPEQARAWLLQNMMTEFYETASLSAYARIADLRLDPHAQAETREVAELISDHVAPIVPVSWEALTGRVAPDREWEWYWAPGTDLETVYGPHSSRGAAIEVARADASGTFTVLEGRPLPLGDHCFDAERVLELWHELNGELANDYGDTMIEPSTEQMRELEGDLGETMARWRRRNRLGRAWSLEMRNEEVLG